jgi:hypothetical protein
MASMISNLLDRYFLPVLRWLSLGVCIAVALNYVAFWWHWEARLPDWGMMPSGAETFRARLALFWAVASLACGAALFDLIRPPIRMRRRIMVLLSAALVLGMMPFLIGHLFLK